MGGESFEIFTGRYDSLPSDRFVKSTVNLSSSQILNGLVSPGQIIIPAPGPGLFIALDKVIIAYKFKSVGYTYVGGTLHFSHLPGNDILVPALLTTLGTESTIEIYNDLDLYNTQFYLNNSVNLVTTGAIPTLGNGALTITSYFTIESF